MSEISDEIGFSEAVRDFGISEYILRKAVDEGIISMRLGQVNNHGVKCLLSRDEIQKNLESIKECKKQSCKKGGRSEMEELMKKGIRGKNELIRHGVSESTIHKYYPRPVANEKMFYCMRLNTWTPACRVDNCGFKGECG